MSISLAFPDFSFGDLPSTSKPNGELTVPQRHDLTSFHSSDIDSEDDEEDTHLGNTLFEPWHCKACTLLNANHIELCSACRAPHPFRKKQQALQARSALHRANTKAAARLREEQRDSILLDFAADLSDDEGTHIAEGGSSGQGGEGASEHTSRAAGGLLLAAVGPASGECVCDRLPLDLTILMLNFVGEVASLVRLRTVSRLYHRAAETPSLWVSFASKMAVAPRHRFAGANGGVEAEEGERGGGGACIRVRSSAHFAALHSRAEQVAKVEREERRDGQYELDSDSFPLQSPPPNDRGDDARSVIKQGTTSMLQDIKRHCHSERTAAFARSLVDDNYGSKPPMPPPSSSSLSFSSSSFSATPQPEVYEDRKSGDLHAMALLTGVGGAAAAAARTFPGKDSGRREVDYYFVAKQLRAERTLSQWWVELGEGWRWVQETTHHLLWLVMSRTPNLRESPASAAAAIAVAGKGVPLNREKKLGSSMVTTVPCGSLPASEDELLSLSQRSILCRTLVKLVAKDWNLVRTSLLLTVALVAEGLARFALLQAPLPHSSSEVSESATRASAEQSNAHSRTRASEELARTVNWCWHAFGSWLSGLERLMGPLELQIAEQRSTDVQRRRQPMPHLHDSAVTIFRHAFLLHPPLLSFLRTSLPRLLVCRENSRGSGGDDYDDNDATAAAVRRVNAACSNFTNEELGSLPSVLVFVLQSSNSMSSSSRLNSNLLPPTPISSTSALPLALLSPPPSSSLPSSSAAAALLLTVFESVDATLDAETAPLMIGHGPSAKPAAVALGIVQGSSTTNAASSSALGNGARGFLRRTFLIPLTLACKSGTMNEEEEDDGERIGGHEHDDDSDPLMAGFRNHSAATKRRKTYFQRR
mmetsp:Transcript_60827/g.122039  ORF Transcript_60827/g.122039 Transcript_60827/m.122039 type:complete len:875 (+) Transcript_60827:133-2757(+)